jgi:hypothetical protein
MDNLYNDYLIVRMASVFNINRCGFYKWGKHPFTKREIENTKLSKKLNEFSLTINTDTFESYLKIRILV